MKNLYHWLWAASLTATLAGCGSTVKLDDVSVEDKAGQPATAGNTDAQSSSGPIALTNVSPNNLVPRQDTEAPVGGARVVYFDYDSFAIRPEFQVVIEAHARILKANKAQKASIEGHTDERGGREYNLALGQKRAEAVRRALTLLGVPDAQLEAVSFGKEKPAALGGSDAAMEKNRRAEIAVR